MITYPSFSIPRSRLDFKSDSIGNINEVSKEFARIERYLARLHAWECESCREIFPQETENIFGACSTCWTEDECLDSDIQFDGIRDEDLAINAIKWIKACRFFDLLPTERGTFEKNPPIEWDYLQSAFTWFGTDRIWKAMEGRKGFVSSGMIPDPEKFTWISTLGWKPKGANLEGCEERPFPKAFKDEIGRGYKNALRKL